MDAMSLRAEEIRMALTPRNMARILAPPRHGMRNDLDVRGVTSIRAARIGRGSAEIRRASGEAFGPARFELEEFRSYRVRPGRIDAIDFEGRLLPRRRARERAATWLPCHAVAGLCLEDDCGT
jgi:hypothetical protein